MRTRYLGLRRSRAIGLRLRGGFFIAGLPCRQGEPGGGNQNISHFVVSPSFIGSRSGSPKPSPSRPRRAQGLNLHIRVMLSPAR
jgi:hypothetical protein